MMETTHKQILERHHYEISVICHDKYLVFSIYSFMSYRTLCAITMYPNEMRELAHALLAAAGEPQYPGATSAIVPNRAVTRPHIFEIGDAVETNDGIHGHIEDIIDAEVITGVEYSEDHDTAAEAK